MYEFTITVLRQKPPRLHVLSDLEKIFSDVIEKHQNEYSLIISDAYQGHSSENITKPLRDCAKEIPAIGNKFEFHSSSKLIDGKKFMKLIILDPNIQKNYILPTLFNLVNIHVHNKSPKYFTGQNPHTHFQPAPANNNTQSFTTNKMDINFILN